MVRGGVYGFLIRHFVAIAGALALLSYTAIYSRQGAPAPIRSDGYSYYVYLPSWFLHGDTTLDGVAHTFPGGEYPEFTAIRRWPGYQSLGESPSDGSGSSDRAVLFRRARADTPDARDTRRLFVVLPARRRPCRARVSARRARRRAAPAAASLFARRRPRGAGDRDVGHQLVPLRGLRQRLQSHLLVLPRRGARGVHGVVVGDAHARTQHRARPDRRR